jgi:hypothetical protein
VKHSNSIPYVWKDVRQFRYGLLSVDNCWAKSVSSHFCERALSDQGRSGTNTQLNQSGLT